MRLKFRTSLTRDNAPWEEAKHPRESDGKFKNGVTHPKKGTLTHKVWQLANTISSATKMPATKASVLAASQEHGLNPATVATQHNLWSKFHGAKTWTAPVVLSPKVQSEKSAKEAGFASPSEAQVPASLKPAAKQLAQKHGFAYKGATTPITIMFIRTGNPSSPSTTRAEIGSTRHGAVLQPKAVGLRRCSKS